MTGNLKCNTESETVSYEVPPLTNRRILGKQTCTTGEGLVSSPVKLRFVLGHHFHILVILTYDHH
jgi:hypothetical protein